MKISQSLLIHSLFCVASLLTSVFGQTNITYSNSMSPNALVQNILLGYGVTASNVTFNYANGNSVVNNARSFTATNFPFSSGVYIRTLGGGTNIWNDPHLNSISSEFIYNGGVLEFDFVAAGNNLSFNYMFASAEYPDYVCSEYNDVFGFFISGPGISGPHPNNSMNLAVIPNTTTPVAINTVNPGVSGMFGINYYCSMANPNYVAHSSYYTNQYAEYSGEEYNGGTVVLPAGVALQCGETYHIKIAIANVSDEVFDSGVYLQANSFQSDAIQVQIAAVAGSDIVYEGCTDASIRFIRPTNQLDDSLVISYTVEGTATMGLDYDSIPNPVVFAPGQDTVTLMITPINDGFSDNNETIIITTRIVNVCGDTIVSTGTLYILDSVTLNINYLNPTVYCIADSIPVLATVTNGFAPYTYEWSNGDTGPTGYLATVDTVVGTANYIITVTDFCGYTGTDTVKVTVNQSIFIDSLVQTPATCLPIGTVYTEGFPYGALLGNPNNPTSYNLNFHWQYENDTLMTFPNQSSLENLSAGWYYLTLTDNIARCSVKDSIMVEAIDIPSAQMVVDPGFGCNPTTAVFSNNSQNSTTYYWDFGDGTTQVTTDLNAVSHQITQTTAIQLVASNGDQFCNDTTYVTVEIVTCGCMNLDAINYNPLAVLDDGSCVFPMPTVTAPNVVTLDGNGVNELFFLNTTYAHNIELTIVNRWGSIIYSGNGDQTSPPVWDGKDKSGNVVSEGVYFYSYKVEGKLGDVVEGHGFLTVVK